MKLFKLDYSCFWPGVILYAREKEHIIKVIEFYRSQIERKNLADSVVQEWVKKEPNLDDIMIVKKGVIPFYSAGRPKDSIILKLDEKKIKKVKITKDFMVELNTGYIKQFEEIQAELFNLKRGELYKFLIRDNTNTNTIYIPEDVMKRIIKLDLTKYLK